jgi:ABC-type Fe3+-hydroxamate transport system substrate-binding protein
VGRRANQIPDVSIEQVLAWNPQVIVTIDRDFD